MDTQIIIIMVMEVEVLLNQCCIHLRKSISVDQYFAFYKVDNSIPTRIAIFQLTQIICQVLKYSLDELFSLSLRDFCRGKRKGYPRD